MRSQDSWRKDPGQWAIIIGSLILAGATAIVAHIYASPWAITLEGASLVFAALGVVAYFRLIRHKGQWLFFGIASWTLGFACLFPILQGWSGVGQAIYGVAGLLFTVGVIWFRVRLTLLIRRRAQEIARSANEELRDEGLFREDGERIVVYADRGRLLRRPLCVVPRLSATLGATR